MLACALALAIWANAEDEADSVDDAESVADFFADFAQSRNGIHLLEADFVQTTVTPDETIVSEGRIVYSRPKRLIFRYDDPELVYMIDRLRAYEYDPEYEQLQIFDLEDRPESEAFYLGFDNNAQRLQEAYIVRLLPPKDPEIYAFALEFVPKENEEDETYFEKITLQLRKGDYLPAEIYIVNDEDSHVEFKISDFKINGEPDPKKTHIFLPEGTMIVDNDTFTGTVGADGLSLPRPGEEVNRVESEPLTEDPVQP